LAIERIRDADRTRKKILDAARREFGMHGFSGARVEAIARRARVNKGLIFYYFQSKEELFRALSEERIARTLPSDASHTWDAPFAWPMALFESDETVDWARYFVWEGISLDTLDPAELPQAELRRSTFERLVGEVARHQANGKLPGRLNPRQLTFFLYVLGIYPHLLPQMALLITGRLPSEQAFELEFAAFVRDLAGLFGSVRPPDAAGPPSPRRRRQS
jgi:AcrR family transcriptional regulator